MIELTEPSEGILDGRGSFPYCDDPRPTSRVQGNTGPDLFSPSSFSTHDFSSAMPSVALTASRLVPVQESPGPSQIPVAKTSVTNTNGLILQPVQQVLNLFRAHRNGWRSSPWYRLPLSPAEFEDLRQCLARDTDLDEYVTKSGTSTVNGNTNGSCG